MRDVAHASFTTFSVACNAPPNLSRRRRTEADEGLRLAQESGNQEEIEKYSKRSIKVGRWCARLRFFVVEMDMCSKGGTEGTRKTWQQLCVRCDCCVRLQASGAGRQLNIDTAQRKER